jgi:phosphate-selective porin OprO and OprP
MLPNVCLVRGVVVLVVFLTGRPAFAQVQAADSEVALLREQVRTLAEKVRQLEERLVPAPSPAPVATAPSAAAPKPPVTTVTDRTISLAAGDGSTTLRLRGIAQVDSRWFFNDGGIVGNDAFLIRRARIIMEGSFNRIFQFQITPDFAGSAASLLNANITAVLGPALQIKVGKFKTPVGIEQAQANMVTAFVERTHPSSLMPSFDVGMQIGGEFAEGRLSYTAGVFNGLADGASSTTNTDTDDHKGVVARIMARPFEGLEVGVGATYSPDLTAATPLTPGYRSDGQQRFFAYDATTVADGDGWRVSPQAAYAHGSLGLMAEYAVSAINVRAGGVRTELKHEAWHGQVTYNLTGEAASFTGVVPRTNFRLGADGWGAVVLALRASVMDLDDQTFPAFASPRTNATEVTSYGVGLNWHPSASVRITADYLQSDFDVALSPTSLLLREGEQVVVTRLQLMF